MALLKEDGSLDIAHIHNLPIEEHIQELNSLTPKQYREYIDATSKIVIQEHQTPVKFVRVNYTLQERLNSGAVLAEDLIKKIEKYINN